MKIAITGASGFVGSELCDYFHNKGHDVLALQRKTSDKEYNVEFYSLPYDVSLKAFENIDVLVHCAHEDYSTKRSGADERNIKGLEFLKEQSKTHGFFLIFLSTFSAHEQAQSHYGKTKIEMEKQLLGENCCILRLGLVLGQRGLFSDIAGMVKGGGIVPMPDGGRQPVQVIAIEDLCQVVSIVATNKTQGVFNIASERIYTMKELYSKVAQSYNQTVRFLPIPLSMIYIILVVLESLKIPFSVTTENALGLKYMKSFSTKSDLEKLGVELKDLDNILNSLRMRS